MAPVGMFVHLSCGGEQRHLIRINRKEEEAKERISLRVAHFSKQATAGLEVVHLSRRARLSHNHYIQHFGFIAR